MLIHITSVDCADVHQTKIVQQIREAELPAIFCLNNLEYSTGLFDELTNYSIGVTGQRIRHGTLVHSSMLVEHNNTYTNLEDGTRMHAGSIAVGGRRFTLLHVNKPAVSVEEFQKLLAEVHVFRSPIVVCGALDHDSFLNLKTATGNEFVELSDNMRVNNYAHERVSDIFHDGNCLYIDI